MKKIIYLFLFILILSFAVTGFHYPDNSGGEKTNTPAIKPAVEKVCNIIASRKSTAKFERIRLFSLGDNGNDKYGINKTVSNASVLKIKRQNLSELINAKPDNISLEIPTASGKNLVIELYKADIFSPDFKVKTLTSTGEQIVSVFPGIHYRGIIKGNNESIASFSFFNDRIMGVFSDKYGNYNLGPINRNNITGDYMLFNESDLSEKNPFECKVDDYNPKFRKSLSNGAKVTPDNPNRQNVRMYYVADYQMYLDGGSETNVVNYISGAFNSVSTIYQNEYIPLQISQIDVYTNPDPFIPYHESYEILLNFGATLKDNFTGDLAQLLSTRRENFGGIAWVGTLCMPYSYQDSAGRYSFCGIDTTYFNFPTYSWTITVMSHELGHNFGSMHTHACWWPVNAYQIGAIDSCYYAEGNCYTNPQTNYNGTLMGYCHLNGAIRLQNGFGPMPGDTVRLRYNQAACFGLTINSSELPTVFALMQNYPNPFNPGTNIQFDVPKDALITIKIYDINGREIARLANYNYYSPGIYFAYFNSYNYSLSSGVYFYKILAVDAASPSNVLFTQIKKMMYIK